MLSCQTKEALQSCLTEKPARKTVYITPTKCHKARKKEVRKSSMIKKPQKHQEKRKTAGTLFKHPKVRKHVIKRSQACSTIQQDLNPKKPLLFFPTSATFCHILNYGN